MVLQAIPQGTQELSGTAEEKQSRTAISKALDTNKSRIDDEERLRNVVPREVGIVAPNDPQKVLQVHPMKKCKQPSSSFSGLI